MNRSDSINGADPGSTASSLVAGVKSLDPASWRRLTTVYGPLVYGWARRAGLHGEDAADITQDVFRSVVAHATQLKHGEPGNTFRGWLWTVTRNKLRDFWRSRNDRAIATGGSDAQALLQLIPEHDPSTSSGSTAGSDGLFRRAVEVVRAEFEERSWQAFWRVTVDGQSAGHVASELGITANAVYVARSRILRRLRETLSGS